MDLFNTSPLANLLPHDGTVNYFGKVFSREKEQFYHDYLLNEIPWKHDEAVMFGKRIITKRKVAWYGDKNFSYTYSNTTKHALPWTKELLELKSKAEELTETVYNSCLLNLYHDGSEGMAYHSDDEKALGKITTIASLSFGADRRFLFKHKTTKQTIKVLLESGSLLVMKDATQANWMHRLPPTKLVTRPRINLTFRKMKF